MSLLDANTVQTFVSALKALGLFLLPFLIIFITLRVKYLSQIVGTLIAVGMCIGYAGRSVAFPFIFNIKSYDELVGTKEFSYLWIFISLCTFLWIVYMNSSGALKADDDGWYFLVFDSGGISEWSIFGRMAFFGAIISAIVGFGVAWLNCNIWNGCVYVLSVIEILIGVTCLIGSIKVNLF